MTEANRNTVWCRVFADELARQGVRHACVAPGSRSSPLVVALAAEGRLRLHPHVDERCAGFFAVGIGRVSRSPAVVITTSGTAAANLLPAIVEASQSEVPLLALTADRPARLRGTDANQTIDQVRLYDGYVRAFWDVPLPRPDGVSLRHLRALAARAWVAALGPPAGPVHLNFPFEKPLEPTVVPGDVPADLEEREPLATRGRPEGRPFVRARIADGEAPAETVDAVAGELEAARRGLIVCGPVGEPSVGPAVRRLAARTEFPLLADPLSGARFVETEGRAIALYDSYLSEAAVARRLRPDLVVRIGASPTSASLLSALEEWDAPQLVIDAGGRWKDHSARVEEYVVAEPAAFCAGLASRLGPIADPAWVESWRGAEACAAEILESELGGVFFEGAAVAEVLRTVPSGTTLFVGNSMPIRDLDAFGAPRSGSIRVVGHRGASGIDGNVSGALGASVVSDGPTVALLGDLAFYHDMNGLLAARSGLDATFVVINNDGGGIFHTLPIREHATVFEPYVVMPHGLDFAHVADLYEIPIVRPDSREALRAALSSAIDAPGAAIVEVRSDREANLERRREVVGAVRRAVRNRLADT